MIHMTDGIAIAGVNVDLEVFWHRLVLNSASKLTPEERDTINAVNLDDAARKTGER
jgi:hypothetical protein